MLSHLEMSNHQLDVRNDRSLVRWDLVISLDNRVVLDGDRGPLPCAGASGLSEGYGDVIGVLVVLPRPYLLP